MTIFEQLQAFTPFNEQEASDRRLMLQYAGLFSDLLTRDNEMAHLTASCWIVNPDKTKVLLAYHNIYDSWAWLGGHAVCDAPNTGRTEIPRPRATWRKTFRAHRKPPSPATSHDRRPANSEPC